MQGFALVDHGSIAILTARTQAARDWIAENMPAHAQTWSGGGVVIEPRYALPILDGIDDAGLTYIMY